ncbi:Alpha-ketoglutarate-dependent sulfonate dioxygenase [Wickerhamomyces ciferrii]|uniref:Alpha-ketoglutarate-dependent sulfonate dioxygenase n=1 Tax=Wickerhamomyces ciferrii (strain ATCC 14091 / BCRC 22168 / CBS 111 / JCM 3599 / NBRC 0793 / NRRL Y-1031 F-60-10) TaxID=1206466 RepID=K0KN94_WICCF|nr:Alpha-ketoglutarate-dependent sulfonate dioxygenase [Wickerhamomyces ciferrii]CCH42829.1 Alpha-ketoglutarate-dependent sulfonate dioxygenase [Wickerhamomyces ciferrii]
MSTATATESQVNEIVQKYQTLDLKNPPKSNSTIQVELKNPNGVKEGFGDDYSKYLPQSTKDRFQRHGIDISKGYPERPQSIPLFLDDAYKIRNQADPNYIERGVNADPEKKALFSKAKLVRNLTKYVGTELVGVQLSDLNDQELDELALLISERIVVFFRNQDLSPQDQLKIGEFFGSVEKHPLAAQVSGQPGVTTIWGKFNRKDKETDFKKRGGNLWHTDLDHEFRGPSLTHLHLDAIPKEASGDTAWTSGYGAFDKLSPEFQKFLEGKIAIHRSAHKYFDRDDVLAGGKHIEREHPLVVTHPVTGWKALFVNRGHTLRIKDLEPEESQTILNYLFNVLEKNLDIQVRFNWAIPEQDRSLGASAIWDNRVSNHYAIADYDDETDERHGTRVTSLGAPPVYKEGSKSQREALGWDK